MLSAARCTLVRVCKPGRPGNCRARGGHCRSPHRRRIGEAGAGTFQFDIDLAWRRAVMQTDAEPCDVIVLVACGLQGLRLPDPDGCSRKPTGRCPCPASTTVAQCKRIAPRLLDQWRPQIQPLLLAPASPLHAWHKPRRRKRGRTGIRRIIVWNSMACRHRRVRVRPCLRRNPMRPSNLTGDMAPGKHHPSCNPIWPCST